MCGIGVLVAPTCEESDAQDVVHRSWPSVLHNIQQRGPDSFNTVQHHFQPSNDARPWTLSLTSSVLSLRGAGITIQPLSSSDGRLLLAWNGQIFDWHASSHPVGSSSKVRLESGENDGLILLDRIQSLLKNEEEIGGGANGSISCQDALNAALSEIEGPYAYVLLDRIESKLYFGRDPLGRRSLLLHRAPQSSSISITSVASQDLAGSGDDEILTELSCSTMHSIDLVSSPLLVQPIPRLTSRFTSPLLLRELRPPTTADTDPADAPTSAQVHQGFLSVLSESVRRRVTNIDTDQPATEAHVAILFSGGLDCTTLALLADRYVPQEQPIDLLNVGFENVRAIEAAKLEKEKRRRALLKGAEKMRAKKNKRNGKDDTETPATEPKLESEEKSGEESDTSSTLLAVEQQGGEMEEDVYAVPDRVTGEGSYAELCQLSPHRRWNFVRINVPYQEYRTCRGIVESLMLPSCSVMDLSIGSALYFASRAVGHILVTSSCSGSKLISYTSPARVLISGLGADELLGGYSRHRQAFTRSSLAGLLAELQLDLDRLPERNLGRDDRILSCHGKEARYPFLDRSVLQFLTDTPVEAKVDLNRIATEGAGGDKRLLRDLAKHLGLIGASELKKRAMQFGTRSAKIDVESRNVKGHHKLN
ncbi:uncharacterized protein UTRI_04328_B [Ustilago trichophora]|uniref:Glutamine amidotransferase type-2 domain-containing protein n=1 Tax=Ustilago trichophora TaxID=86804 RepID=A0A5C3EDD5_9BASI|nr:uncharacterized protein UTRI_04328_B [Ustilago trichophora]